MAKNKKKKKYTEAVEEEEEVEEEAPVKKKKKKREESEEEDAASSLIRRVLKVTLDYEGDEIELQLSDSLVITDDLDKEVDEAPREMAFIGALLSEASKEYDEMKLELQIWEAEKDQGIREETFKITEARVIREIQRDKSWRKKKKQLIGQNALVDKLKYAYEAYKKKADLIQTKAADRRREP